MAPGPGQGGQARNRPDGHASAGMALQSVVDPYSGWLCGRVLASKGDNLFFRNSADPCGPFRRELNRSSLELIVSCRITVNIVSVKQAFGDDSAHDRKRECSVSSRRQLNVVVTVIQSLVAVGINAYQARTRLYSALNLRPQMDIGGESIGAPEHDQASEMKILDISPDLNTANGVAKTFAAGGRTNRTS